MISATREAEARRQAGWQAGRQAGRQAGESLEPGGRRLPWAEITPLHSSLGDRGETLSRGGGEQARTLPPFTAAGPFLGSEPMSFLT